MLRSNIKLLAQNVWRLMCLSSIIICLSVVMVDSKSSSSLSKQALNYFTNPSVWSSFSYLLSATKIILSNHKNVETGTERKGQKGGGGSI